MSDRSGTGMVNPGTPSRWRLVRRIITCALVLGLLTVALFVTRNRQQWREIEAKLTAIRDAGEPLSGDEVLGRFLQQHRAESSSRWRNVLRGVPEFKTILREDQKGRIPFVALGNGPAGGQWDDIGLSEQLLAEYLELLGEVQTAAESSDPATFPVDAEDILHGVIPWRAFRNLWNLLQLESQVAVFRNDPDRTTSGFVSRLALSRSVKHYPSFMDQEYRRMYDRAILRDLEQALPNVSFSEDQLLRLQTLLNEITYAEGLTSGLLTERAEVIMLFQDVDRAYDYLRLHDHVVSTMNDSVGEHLKNATGRRSLPSETGRTSRALWRFSRARDFLLFLDTSSRLIEASRADLPRSLALSRQIEDDVETEMNRKSYLLTSLKLTSMHSGFVNVARVTALNRMTQAAIAIERFRVRSGRMPADLDSLVPEFLSAVPLDPFNGRPLCFSHDEEGYTVYSVGDDGTDNGGSGGAFGRDPDVTFQVRFTRD